MHAQGGGHGLPRGRHSCDLQETCSCNSSICPSDHGKQWGTTCTAADGGALTGCGKVCLDSLHKQCNGILSAAKHFGNLLPDESTPDPFGECHALSYIFSGCSTLSGTCIINGVRYTNPWHCNGCTASQSSRSSTDADGNTNTIQLNEGYHQHDAAPSGRLCTVVVQQLGTLQSRWQLGTMRPGWRAVHRP